jgi:nicotinamidase-related amidase
MPTLDPRTTALVLIDLQKGILARELAPYSSQQVTQVGIDLAQNFRKAGAPVGLVNVAFSKDRKDVLSQPVDQPNVPPPGGYPADFSELADGLAQPGDLHITKRQWGAFYGTELDLQLRRRGILTIVIGGVATNMGVESTARNAYEHGYGVVFVEDAMSTFTADMHNFAVKTIFPRLGRVVKSADIAFV